MATLINRVRAITGSSTAQSSHDAVLDALKSGAKYVLRSLPRGLLTEATTIHSISDGNGVNLEREWVLNVSRNNFPAIEQSYDEAYAYYTTALTTDGSVTSWFQATSVFPKYYYGPSPTLGNVGLFIKPDPSTAAVGKIVHVEVPKLTTASSEWSIDAYDIPAINYAAALDYRKLQSYYIGLAGDAAATIITEVTSSLAKYEAALPTWTSPTMGTIPTTITASISYTKPSTDIYTLPPALSFSETLPTWSTPTLGAIPTTITPALAYVAPTGYTLPSTMSHSATLPTWSSDTMGVQPTTITPSLTYTAPSTATYTLPPGTTYAETLGTWSAPSVTTDITDITSALAIAKNLLSWSTLLTAGQDAEYWLGQEDEDMVRANSQIVASQLDRTRAALQREATKLNKYQSDIQAETARMGAEINNYKAEIEFQIQNANNILKSYELELQNSSKNLEASAEVERLNIQNWINVANDMVSRYSAETGNESARFQSETSTYRAEIERQVSIVQNYLANYGAEQGDSQATLQAETEEQRLKVQNWVNVVQDLVNRYSAEVSKEGTRTQSDIATYRAEIERQVAVAQNHLASYQTEQQNSASDMQASIEEERLKIQNWANVANNIISKYQAEVQKEAARYSNLLGAAKGYLEEGQLRIGKIQVLGVYIQSAAQYGQSSVEMFQQASMEIDRHLQASLGGGKNE